jgi:hypothetical protein
MKFPNFFFNFCGSFLPSRSGSGFRFQKQKHTDPDPQHCGKHCFLFHVRLPLLVHRAEEVAPEVALSGLEVRPLVGSAQRPRPEALVEDGRGSLGAAQCGTRPRGQPARDDLRTARTRWHFAATSTNYVRSEECCVAKLWGNSGNQSACLGGAGTH